jgi:hypothetical protein
MSWAKLYKTSSWHQVNKVLLLSLEKDNLALLQQGEILEQRSRHSSSDSSMASDTSAETDAKQSEAKFKSIFSFFRFCSLFFRFFRFFLLFFAFFRLMFVLLRFFRLFYLRFRFRFLVFRIKVNHVKSGFFIRFQAKRNFRFNFKFCFRSESEGAPYSGPRSWR